MRYAGGSSGGGASATIFKKSTPVSWVRSANTTTYPVNSNFGPAAGGPITLANMAIANGGFGYITKAKFTSSIIAMTSRFRLAIFNVIPASIADGAGVTAPLSSENPNYLGSIYLDACKVGAGSPDRCFSENISDRFAYECAAGGTSLFIYPINLDSIATPTSGATSELTLWGEVYG